jgi:hypothetical protein
MNIDENNFQQLPRNERLILAVLEEAGEEHLSALVNTLERRLIGIPSNILRDVSKALIHLFNRDLARLARARDPVHHRLVPLSIHQSTSIASNLELLLERSLTDHLWHWKGDDPIADVMLTESGLATAREVLLADGWPGR